MRDLSGRPDLCSVNTATLGFREPLSSLIDAVARAGFGGLSPWRREVEGQDIKAIARQLRDAQLVVPGYCRSTYFPAAGRPHFLSNVDDNKRAISDAAVLGAESFVLVVGSIVPPHTDLAQARGMVREGIGLLLDHARQQGVKLALEPLHPVYACDRSCITTVREALDLCHALDPGNDVLGVLLDVYHIWWDPALAASIAAARGRITGFHVNDWLLPTRDVLNDRGMMGDGVIDIRSIRSMAEDAGFDGLVEVEIFSTETWWKRPVAEILDVIKQRLAHAA
jgi:sugar phosphate isomerase/epimerase